MTAPAPAALPAWLGTLARLHQEQNIVEFILHGNVADLQPTPDGQQYMPLPEYLAQVLLRPRTYVALFHPENGLRWRTPEMEAAFRQSVAQFDAAHKTAFADSLPKDPTQLFALLEQFFRARLLQNEGIGLVIEDAHLLAPAGTLPPAQQALVNTLVSFSRDNLYARGDFAVLLLTPSQALLNNQLIQNGPHTHLLDVPPPDEAARRAYLEWALARQPLPATANPEALAKASLGLGLNQLGQALAAARQNPELSLPDAIDQIRQGGSKAHAGSPMALLHPDSVPGWVKTFARMLGTRTVTQFILHGNIVDFVRQTEVSGATRYLRLRDFLQEVLFPDRQIVTYDRAAGIGFANRKTEEDFYDSFFYQGVFKKDLNAFRQWLDRLKSTENAFLALERYFEARIQQGVKVAFIVDYAETLVPMGAGGALAPQDRSMLVFFQKWAKNTQFLNADFTTVLLAENLNDVHQALVRNPFTFEIEIPYPTEADRLGFIRHFQGSHPTLEARLEMSTTVLGRDTAGLTIVQLRTLLAEIMESASVFTFKELTLRKREIIESEAGGMLAFVESRFSLDNVAGHRYAKQHLREAAAALKSGRADVLPMGYLVNGPVGTGKTFLVSCFAAEIGIPMVELKNFRSQYVGVTEANLEKVLRLLRAMSPVAVMIDEADAALGNRGQGGDSGVSSRVFSMIASFMSNTEHRGRILWFLLTARPDLMPVDLKRQGRAEEHIALFYPETPQEKRELFEAMLRKTGIRSLDPAQVPDVFFEDLAIFSGADMEAALTRAKFRAVSEGLAEPTLAVIKATFADFIPPNYPEEVELMNLVAVLECTSRDLLPERFRSLPRHQVQERIEELRARMGR